MYSYRIYFGLKVLSKWILWGPVQQGLLQYSGDYSSGQYSIGDYTSRRCLSGDGKSQGRWRQRPKREDSPTEDRRHGGLQHWTYPSAQGHEAVRSSCCGSGGAAKDWSGGKLQFCPSADGGGEIHRASVSNTVVLGPSGIAVFSHAQVMQGLV